MLGRNVKAFAEINIQQWLVICRWLSLKNQDGPEVPHSVIPIDGM